MGHLNIEFKARCRDPVRIKEYLQIHQAHYQGQDHQIDTYFNVPHGRLKLREGNIENSLIAYRRANEKEARRSEVSFSNLERLPKKQVILLKEALTRSNGILVVVDKLREIYFIDNVKFHIDQVRGLGHFMEVEAIDRDGSIQESYLRKQCEHYKREFGIKESDLVELSYSDLLIEKH